MATFKSESEKRMRDYDKAIKAARALKPVPHKCHDCKAAPGQPHGVNCDSAICTICGTQLLQCGHEKGNSIHTGIETQEIKILCEALSLFTKWVVDEVRDGLPMGRWERCARDDPEAGYDLNTGIELYVQSLRAARKQALSEMRR